jgi:hypothetical protein
MSFTFKNWVFLLTYYRKNYRRSFQNILFEFTDKFEKKKLQGIHHVLIALKIINLVQCFSEVCQYKLENEKLWIADPQKRDHKYLKKTKSEHLIGWICPNLTDQIGLFCNPGF